MFHDEESPLLGEHPFLKLDDKETKHNGKLRILGLTLLGFCAIVGGLVLTYNKVSTNIIAQMSTSFDETAAPPKSYLCAGESLFVKQGLLSENGKYSLTYQSDNNLVVSQMRTSDVVWSSDTGGCPKSVEMRTDGNLIITDCDNKVMWSTKIASSSKKVFLKLLNDGNLVVYNDATKTKLWSVQVRYQLKSDEPPDVNTEWNLCEFGETDSNSSDSTETVGSSEVGSSEVGSSSAVSSDSSVTEKSKESSSSDSTETVGSTEVSNNSVVGSSSAVSSDSSVTENSSSTASRDKSLSALEEEIKALESKAVVIQVFQSVYYCLNSLDFCLITNI